MTAAASTPTPTRFPPPSGASGAGDCSGAAMDGSSWSRSWGEQPTARAGASQDRQVALQLPRRDLHAVVLPLLALDLDVAVEHVLAERPQHELGFRGQLDRLAQRLGE